jgi:hypothetical protein
MKERGQIYTWRKKMLEYRELEYRELEYRELIGKQISKS